MTAPRLPVPSDGLGEESSRHQAISVVFVSTQFLPLVGGAELRALREARSLHSAGHQVRVVTLRQSATWPEAEEIDGIPVQRTGGLFVRGRLRLRFGAQWLVEWGVLRALLRARRSYQVIHLRHLDFLARPAVLAALLLRKPLLVRLASAGPDGAIPVRPGAQTSLYAGPLDPASPFLRVPARSWSGGDLATLRQAQWLAGLTLWLLRRRGVTFVATSTGIRTALLRAGVHPSQIVVLPNGIDLPAFAEVAARVAARAAAPAGTTPTVLCVARYRYEKGLDVLLHAWREVCAALPGARLVLLGGGGLRPQLEALATALGLGEQVRFDDLVHDVRPQLAEADVFVLPSRFEGMPNALLEAMACGLPCVATRVSGSEDLLVDGASGLLVPPGDPHPLAHALLTLLTDRARARLMGAAAQQRVASQFHQNDLTERLVALYARVIASGSAPAHQTSSPLAAEDRPAAHLAPGPTDPWAGRPPASSWGHAREHASEKV